MGRFESPFKTLPLPQASKATKHNPSEGKDKGIEDEDCRGFRRRTMAATRLQGTREQSAHDSNTKH
jgi:hypothetical protein